MAADGEPTIVSVSKMLGDVISAQTTVATQQTQMAEMLAKLSSQVADVFSRMDAGSGGGASGVGGSAGQDAALPQFRSCGRGDRPEETV